MKMLTVSPSHWGVFLLFVLGNFIREYFGIQIKSSFELVTRECKHLPHHSNYIESNSSQHSSYEQKYIECVDATHQYFLFTCLVAGYLVYNFILACISRQCELRMLAKDGPKTLEEYPAFIFKDILSDLQNADTDSRLSFQQLKSTIETAKLEHEKRKHRQHSENMSKEATRKKNLTGLMRKSFKTVSNIAKLIPLNEDLEKGTGDESGILNATDNSKTTDKRKIRIVSMTGGRIRKSIANSFDSTIGQSAYKLFLSQSGTLSGIFPFDSSELYFHMRDLR